MSDSSYQTVTDWDRLFLNVLGLPETPLEELNLWFEEIKVEGGRLQNENEQLKRLNSALMEYEVDRAMMRQKLGEIQLLVEYPVSRSGEVVDKIRELFGRE